MHTGIYPTSCTGHNQVQILLFLTLLIISKVVLIPWSCLWRRDYPRSCRYSREGDCWGWLGMPFSNVSVFSNAEGQRSRRSSQAAGAARSKPLWIVQHADMRRMLLVERNLESVRARRYGDSDRERRIRPWPALKHKVSVETICNPEVSIPWGLIFGWTSISSDGSF